MVMKARTRLWAEAAEQSVCVPDSLGAFCLCSLTGDNLTTQDREGRSLKATQRRQTGPADPDLWDRTWPAGSFDNSVDQRGSTYGDIKMDAQDCLCRRRRSKAPTQAFTLHQPFLYLRGTCTHTAGGSGADRRSAAGHRVTGSL